jgi:hypothetical protein
MSRVLTATLPGDVVPARRQLQTAIDALRFKCKLGADYSPAAPGYLACDLDGEDAGFTFRIKPGDTGAAMLLDWGGDPREEAAASIVCVALAEYFGAIISRDGAPATLADLIEAVGRAIT